jgi:hypothetical protein
MPSDYRKSESSFFCFLVENLSLEAWKFSTPERHGGSKSPLALTLLVFPKVPSANSIERIGSELNSGRPDASQEGPWRFLGLKDCVSGRLSVDGADREVLWKVEKRACGREGFDLFCL